ncbi:MAG: hypothetical protein R6V10_00505 [bacterium]
MSSAEVHDIAFSNMHTFEGQNQPEIISASMRGGAGKPILRIPSVGSALMTILHCVYYRIFSGIYNSMLAISFEKQSDGLTQPGLGQSFWWRHWP